MNNNIIKTIIVLIIGLLLGSCYMMNEPTSGDLSLSMNLPSRSPGDGGEYWIVGLVVDAAYENDLINLMRLFDKSDYFEGINETLSVQFEDEADDILEDMLQKGAVRFDGGRFFFQFKLEDAGETGDFTITGIPTFLSKISVKSLFIFKSSILFIFLNSLLTFSTIFFG